MNRPFDLISFSVGKRAMVLLKNGTVVSGVLKAFDVHMNVALEDASLQSDGSSVKVGKILLRGDSIVYIAPE